MPGDERPTLPPPPDPLAVVFARIEQKLDDLHRLASTCFDELVATKRRVSDLELDVEFIKRQLRDTDQAPELNGGE